MTSGAELIRKVKEQIEEVDPKDVFELQQNGNGAVIVDVREQHEFEEAHLPGAVHVPRGHLESRIEGAVSDRSQPVILYCASGNRSAFAAHTMTELMGYEDVASMRGTCTAPGRWASSNSCCSRTSTITGGRVPFPFESRSWTSLGSTSRIWSLIVRRTSAPEAITSQRIAPGRPCERPGEDPDLDFQCGSSGGSHLLIEASSTVSGSRLPADMGWRPHLSNLGALRSMDRPRMTRRDDSLIGQIVAANVVLFALTLLAASIAAGLDLGSSSERWEFMILALAIVLTLCTNLWMLQRRFRPLEHLIDEIEAIDPSEPAPLELRRKNPVEEIERLSASFHGLLQRIEEERRRSGQLAMRAQEEERRRLARDLHDEVNQALTAILLRLEALAQETPPEREPEVAELKRLVNQAMDGLLNLARQLRPSALDDHGLVPAVETQLKRFSSRTGIEVRLDTRGEPDELPEVVQTAIYRVAQEALTNVTRHAGATVVELDLGEHEGAAELRVRDDGDGFDPAVVAQAASEEATGGLGLVGMAERARLVGGELDVRSAPGGGTSITLRVPG